MQLQIEFCFLLLLSENTILLQNIKVNFVGVMKFHTQRRLCTTISFPCLGFFKYFIQFMKRGIVLFSGMHIM